MAFLRFGPVRFACILFVALSLVPPARGQDGSRFLKWLGPDIASFAHLPSGRTLAVASAELASLGALTLLDPTVNHEVREGYHGVFADYVNITNRIGAPESDLVAVGVFGISLLTHDRRFQDAAFTSLESFVVAGFFTVTSKFIIGRSRPEEGVGEYTFHPFTGNRSFPSGHATHAFALLTPWVVYYPGFVSYGLLVVGATGTALARIAKDKHWLTDVIAGSSVGFFTAWHLSRRHLRKTGDPGAGVSVSPFGFRVALPLGS